MGIKKGNAPAESSPRERERELGGTDDDRSADCAEWVVETDRMRKQKLRDRRDAA